jgi:hypothetical protein
MKLATTLIAAGCVLAAASTLLGRQPLAPPGPAQDELPAPEYFGDEQALAADEKFWLPPPVPQLPYGFTWDHYQGAAYEQDIYGYRRLNPPPRKSVSCHGWFAACADSVAVMFSYPTENRPPKYYCPKQHPVPGKISFGHRAGCAACGNCSSCTSCTSCACQAQSAPIVQMQLQSPPPQATYFPTPEPAIESPQAAPQPRRTLARPPVRPIVPPVLTDGGGLPALPGLDGDLQSPANSSSVPAPVLTEEPATQPSGAPAPMGAKPRGRTYPKSIVRKV